MVLKSESSKDYTGASEGPSRSIAGSVAQPAKRSILAYGLSRVS